MGSAGWQSFSSQPRSRKRPKSPCETPRIARKGVSTVPLPSRGTYLQRGTSLAENYSTTLRCHRTEYSVPQQEAAETQHRLVLFLHFFAIAIPGYLTKDDQHRRTTTTTTTSSSLPVVGRNSIEALLTIPGSVLEFQYSQIATLQLLNPSLQLHPFILSRPRACQIRSREEEAAHPPPILPGRLRQRQIACLCRCLGPLRTIARNQRRVPPERLSCSQRLFASSNRPCLVL